VSDNFILSKNLLLILTSDGSLDQTDLKCVKKSILFETLDLTVFMFPVGLKEQSDQEMEGLGNGPPRFFF